MAEEQDKVSNFFAANDEEMKEEDSAFSMEEDWQAAVLKNKNLLNSFGKLKSNQAVALAENGPVAETEQQISANLPLTYGKIEYIPLPRNSFCFKKAYTGSQQWPIFLNCNEMLTMIRHLPEAMRIAHEIETKHEEAFEKRLKREFPDLDLDDGEGRDVCGAFTDDGVCDEEPDQNRIYSKMIQERGVNFVSLDVSKYMGTCYIWLKTYFLSKKQGKEKAELLGTKQMFRISAYDDLDAIVKFYKDCILLNKTVQQRLKDKATSNCMKYFRSSESERIDGKRVMQEEEMEETEQIKRQKIIQDSQTTD